MALIVSLRRLPELCSNIFKWFDRLVILFDREEPEGRMVVTTFSDSTHTHDGMSVQ